MTERVVSAEVEARPNETVRAAQTLQRLGFRVLHSGPSISVQGAQRLWEKTFAVSFKQQRKRVSKETGAEVSYPQVQTDTVPIPVELQDLIKSVAFVEPPERFGAS